MGLARAQEILTGMVADLERVRGLPGGGDAAAIETPPGSGLLETLLTIASPFIALALLFLIVAIVLGRGLGRVD